MAEGADWLQSHSTGHRALTLALCFPAALGVAWSIGELVYPDSQLAPVACGAALVLTLGLGYKLWAAFAAATLTRHLFSGFAAASLRFVFTRRPRDGSAAVESLKNALRDRDALEMLLLRLRARSRVFTWLGWLSGAMAGAVVGAFTAEPGFFSSLLLFTVVGGAYGIVISRLGYHGLLPPPMEGD